MRATGYDPFPPLPRGHEDRPPATPTAACAWELFHALLPRAHLTSLSLPYLLSPPPPSSSGAAASWAPSPSPAPRPRTRSSRRSSSSASRKRRPLTPPPTLWRPRPAHSSNACGEGGPPLPLPLFLSRGWRRPRSSLPLVGPPSLEAGLGRRRPPGGLMGGEGGCGRPFRLPLPPVHHLCLC